MNNSLKLKIAISIDIYIYISRKSTRSLYLENIVFVFKINLKKEAYFKQIGSNNVEIIFDFKSIFRYLRMQDFPKRKLRNKNIIKFSKYYK